MNPQFDSRNGFGDGEIRGPFGFNGRRPGRQGPPQPFGPGPENEGRQFGPRQGTSFGTGNERRPMPPPFGHRDDDRQRSDDRRGRQGPPPSFGPGDEGQRGPFGPREDDRRGPFEPDGRRGRQEPPPPQPFGPSGDDDERPGPPPPFGPPDEEGRRGPFGPRDGDRWGPSEGRHGRHGPPPPPFGPGGDDDRRGPFGPRGDDRWGPFGPGSRRGRQGPPPPPFGPGGDERRGRQWPPRPWGPPGGRHHGGFPPRHGGGPWGFGGNQENEEFNQRQTSMWQIGAPNRGKDSRGFVYRLLHETNCVNANGTCLCCCGPYIPNVANKTCDDLRQLFPGIEDTADALMGIDENQDSESPPTEEPMDEISPSSELPFEEISTPQRRANTGPAGPVKIPKPDQDFK
uniref:Uncharacterized protein n=1 Tax=Panagrolaimus sp. ES5 TaxID=591445 RepID=A0AC34GNS1_9BILA